MTTTPVLKIKKLDPLATLPAYHSADAAGMDIAACLPRGDFASPELTIRPGQIVKVPTGFSMAIPSGYEGQVRPRSGLATRHGLTVVNAPGTIDADYRGEVFIALINLGPHAVRVVQGDRIAQRVITPVSRAAVLVVAELEETLRGGGGFGSTGVGKAPGMGAGALSG